MVAFAGGVQVYVLAPVTAATEYTAPFVPGHIPVVTPVIVPGVEGLSRMVRLLNELLPAQLTAATFTVLEVNAPKFTVTEFVP
jgi:hypothetical protein